jgi:putative ABC transport system permease protein
VVLDGGAPLRGLTRAVQPLGFEVAGEYVGDLEVVAGYRRVLYAVAAVIIGVGLAALLIAGIDRASERRRHLAALAVLGVPGRVVRRSQLLQALAPLAVGIPVAAGIGLLAGGAYLQTTATPWPAVALLVLAVAAAAGLVAGGTLLGLGGPIRPADLRRE